MFLIGIAPLLLSAYVDDRGFGEESASWLSSGELLASAIAAIAVAGWLTRRSRRATAGLGLGLVVVAQLLSMAQLDFLPLFALRALAGLGAGLAGAASTAAAAGTQNPERVFASASFVTAILGAITIGPIGMAIGAYGAAGAFVIAAAVTFLVFPLLVGLPAPISSRSATASKPSGQHILSAVAVLAALFAFMLGQNAVWGFTARIGQSAGLSVEEVSWILGVTALAGLAGAAAAATLGASRGRTVPMLLSIAGTVASVFVLVVSATPAAYIAANAAWTFLFAFSMPYFIGTLAALDPTGRWAAMGTGVAGVGAALGPAAVGRVVAATGYGSLGWLMLVMGILAAALITPVLLTLDRDNT
jgi:predicted MFS family arabinose efflux permease